MIDPKIRKTYPELMAERLTSIQPIELDKKDCEILFSFKTVNRSFLSKLLCKIGIHKFILISDFIHGIVLTCKCCGKIKNG